LRPPLSCAKYPVDALYLIPLRRYTTLHRILYGSASSLPFGCSAFSSRMLTRGAAKAMRSPLSPRPSLVTPLANNRRASPARHHISRRLEVARQHWLSDIRYGPVPFQLSKRRQHIRAAARFKVRNCIIEAIGWYLQVLKWSDAPRNEAHCTAVHRSPGQRYTSSAPRRIP
jgi:hypothetical protein